MPKGAPAARCSSNESIRRRAKAFPSAGLWITSSHPVNCRAASHCNQSQLPCSSHCGNAAEKGPAPRIGSDPEQPGDDRGKHGYPADCPTRHIGRAVRLRPINHGVAPMVHDSLRGSIASRKLSPASDLKGSNSRCGQGASLAALGTQRHTWLTGPTRGLRCSQPGHVTVFTRRACSSLPLHSIATIRP